MENTDWIKSFYLSICVALLLCIAASCSSTTTTPLTQPSPPPSTNVELACERDGYPCTQAEVSREVQAENFKLLGQLSERSESGESVEALANWLRSQPDVVQVQTSTFGLRFRINGGRPVGFQFPTGISQAITPLRPTAYSPVLTPQGTTGRDTNQDGKVNNRDERSALLLAPFRWEFSTDSTENTELILEVTQGYDKERIKRFVNQEVTLDAFRSWEAYDVIHVVTHGSYYCDEDNNCTQELYTGVIIGNCPSGDFDPGTLAFEEILGMLSTYGPETGVTYQCKTLKDDKGEISRFMFLAIEADWFLRTYPNGLDNKIIWFSSCQLFKNVVAATNDESFTNFLNKGKGSMYLGWNETVRADVDTPAVDKFFTLLAIRGMTTEAAFNRLDDAERTSSYTDPNTNKTVTASLVRFGKFEASTQMTTLADGGNRDLRIREIISLIDGQGDKLKDGTSLTAQGELDDGKADNLDVVVQVDGVMAGEAEDSVVRLELDGQPIGLAVSLSGATKLDAHSYQLKVNNVATNVSLSAGKTYTLEAIVDLPEGGESRYEVLVNFVAGECRVLINWSATEGGLFPSGRAFYVGGSRGDPEGEISLGLGDSSSDHQLVEFFVRAGGTSLSASFTGGGSVGPVENQTGVFTPNPFSGFTFATPNPDDASRRSIGSSSSRNPGALSITEYGNGVIKGSFEAEVFIQQYGRVLVSGSFEAPYLEDFVFQDVTKLTTVCNSL